MKRKTERLEIRLTPEEKSQLFQLATMAGMSVASYLLGNSLGDKIGDVILKQKKESGLT